ncbi:MAG TPA: transglycosylase SLT domain-containing protein [Arenimonas sp.]|nr:transglycosylase SLT domain-containing protein [Arenimonas sp.]
MPVKPNRDMPDKPSSTPPIVSPVVEPENTTQPVPDEIINMVEAHVVDTPVVSDGMNKRLGSTVFARLKNDFSGPICNDNAAINQWKKRYAGNPRAFSNHLGEILPLLDYVSSEVERRKLPAEFALIPIIESWYQPHAVGAGGPSGMWQMIGTTAKNHGIKIQADYDGRFSVVDSTDAALSYLGTLQGMFKDWQRAVMGYNAGEFRVLRAIRSSGNKSEGQDHWPHGLSPITYAYIAKLQALSCLISQPEKNNLSLPEAREFTPLAAILVEADSGSLDSIAKRHQLDAEILKRNNPAYRRGQISIHAPRRILMPAYLAAGSVANLVNTEAQNSQTTSSGSAEKTTLEASTGSHEIKSGDTLWSIAKRYGISITSLRKLNGLGRNPVLRVGQILKLAP